MELPPLYGKPSSGTKVKQWAVSVVDNDGTSATIVRRHGYVNCKITEARKDILVGKNIGKKNETTPLQQATNEANSLWKKQVERGYAESLDAPQTVQCASILPMLAHDFNKRSKDITRKFVTQPKLDGVRLLASCSNGKLTCTSRTGKPVEHLDHIFESLHGRVPEGVTIDGELYTCDIPFEELSGLFRRKKLTADQLAQLRLLKYHVFDMYDSNNPNAGFLERYNTLSTMLQKSEHIVIVQSTAFDTENIHATVVAQHKQHVQEGYEGVMVRNCDSPYVPTYRSKHLQKYKEFKDDEYTIVGGKEATGEDAGTVIFECSTPAGDHFHVRPRGSRELRSSMWITLDKYIGKKLTVRYQELSESQIPRFPVGIAVRDYE